MDKAGKKLSKIILYLLVVLLCLGIAGAIVMVMRKLTAVSGMYVVYAGQEITSDNDGISIEWSGTSYAAKFTICDTDDFGIYSAEDCTVKIIPNVTTEKDFEFTIDSKNYKYSNIPDLSAAFTENNGSIIVDGDGNFTLYFSEYYTSKYIDTVMDTVISIVYDSDVEISSSADISSYPYFAIEITSPDGGTIITIPLIISGNYIKIEIDPNHIIF